MPCIKEASILLIIMPEGNQANYLPINGSNRFPSKHSSYLDDLVDLKVLEGWIQGHAEERTQTAVSGEHICKR